MRYLCSPNKSNSVSVALAAPPWICALEWLLRIKWVESKDLPSWVEGAIPCKSAEEDIASNVAEILVWDAAADIRSKHFFISVSSETASLLSHAATNQFVVRLFCNKTTWSCRHASISREKGTFVQITQPANLPTNSKKVEKRAHTPWTCTCGAEDWENQK